MLPRLLLRFALMFPILAWVALCVLGNLDIDATARVFQSADVAYHAVLASL